MPTPLLDLDFRLLPNATAWPRDYFVPVARSAGAFADVNNGVGRLCSGATFTGHIEVMLQPYLPINWEMERVFSYPDVSNPSGGGYDIVSLAPSYENWWANAGLALDDNATGGSRPQTEFVYAVMSPTSHNFIYYLSNVATGFAGDSPISATANQKIRQKLRKQGNFYKSKMWIEGTTEPNEWIAGSRNNAGADSYKKCRQYFALWAGSTVNYIVNYHQIKITGFTDEELAQNTIGAEHKLDESAASGAATVDFSTGNVQKIILTGNLSSLTFKGAGSGGMFPQYELHLVQDATGSRTLTAPAANIKWAGSVAPTLSTGANKRDIFKFRYFDGAWWETDRSMNVG